MKIIKQTSGKTLIILSKIDWTNIGKKAKWNSNYPNVDNGYNKENWNNVIEEIRNVVNQELLKHASRMLNEPFKTEINIQDDTLNIMIYALSGDNDMASDQFLVELSNDAYKLQKLANKIKTIIKMNNNLNILTLVITFQYTNSSMDGIQFDIS